MRRLRVGGTVRLAPSMRLPSSRALLSLSLLPLVVSLQLPLSLNTTSTTIVDVLSQDPDYESLLHLLQRAKLIPTLNKLNGSTFFAPTNKAIKHAESLLATDNDNVQHALRQRLFYHLLNYTLPDGDSQDLEVLQTLYFPDIPEEPPTKEPPPSPPWIPIPGGSLGGASQRLRITKRDRVGVNAFGQGGISISKEPVYATNGVVMGVDKVIDLPANLAEVVRSRPELSYLSRILDPLHIVNQLLNTTPALTLFLPVNGAWEALHPLERLYLESEFATDDLQLILQMHAVVDKEEHHLSDQKSERVIYSEMFDPGINLTTLSSTSLSIRTEDKKTIVGSSAEIIEPDIYASNGVLHLVSSLLIEPDSLKLTTEKYLLALNCTRFVSLLHSVNLEALVNGTEKYTVLAIRDDVLALYGYGDEASFFDGIPGPGSKKLERTLRYHFIQGEWSPESLSNGLLLDTALSEDGLGGSQQVLKVSVEDKDKSESSIKFGGAGVVGDFITLPNTTTTVYFLSRPLSPPTTVLQMALPRIHLSTFLAVLSSLPVPRHPPSIPLSSYPRTTYMIPHNEAFGAVGVLVKEWLLGDFEGSKADLERVVRHHIIDGVVYADKLVDHGRKTYRTLEGSDVQVNGGDSANSQKHSDADKGAQVAVMTPSGGWPGMQATIYAQDLLTDTGVIHEVSGLLIPRSVVIGIGKLVKAAGGTTMAGLIVRAGMEWVLTGEGVPDNFIGLQKERIAWTLLCPTDESFSKYNLTELYADQERMQEIVRQHLIPTPPQYTKAVAASSYSNRPLIMDDDATYSTAISSTSAFGDIVFRQSEDQDTKVPYYVVGIKGARGTNSQADWAKVISWGRTTPGAEPNVNATSDSVTDSTPSISGVHTVWVGNAGGGVISIDRVLLPYQPPWWVSWGKPAVVGAGGGVFICLFFWGVNVLWRKDLTEATYEPVGGFGRGDEEDED